MTSPSLAQRGGDGGLAAHGDEIGGDEAGRAFGDRAQVDVLGQRHPGEEAAQQLDPGAQVGEGEAQLAVDELGRAQAGVDGLGRGRRGDEREAGRGDRVAQRVEHEGGQRRRRGGGQQGLDVGDDEQRARTRPGLRAGAHDGVVDALGGRAGLQRCGARSGQLDAPRPGRGRGAAGEGELADALRSDDQHTQPGGATEPFQQLGAVEGELQPLDEAVRGGGVAHEVLDGDGGRGVGLRGAARTGCSACAICPARACRPIRVRQAAHVG